MEEGGRKKVKLDHPDLSEAEGAEFDGLAAFVSFAQLNFVQVKWGPDGRMGVEYHDGDLWGVYSPLHLSPNRLFELFLERVPRDGVLQGLTYVRVLPEKPRLAYGAAHIVIERPTSGSQLQIRVAGVDRPFLYTGLIEGEQQQIALRFESIAARDKLSVLTKFT